MYNLLEKKHKKEHKKEENFKEIKFHGLRMKFK